MKIMEIVFGDSCYFSMDKMKKLNSKKNDKILKFNTLFCVGDLSRVRDYIIDIPNDLKYEDWNSSFKEEMNELNKAINDHYKIRIWTSHYDIYSYLLMLYLCDYLKNTKSDVYVIYSDEYDKDCISPSCVISKDLDKLIKVEHKLTYEEINTYSDIWNNLVNENSELRIIENGIVKSVSFNYFDQLLLNNLKDMGSVPISKLVAIVMSTIIIHDNLFFYLIKLLIKDNKIRVVTKGDNLWHSIIEVNENKV